jgi:YidC/Oxa1 family membrane protein insertase
MKKDLSMEARLLIAFVLMGLVLVVSNYVYKPATAPATGANSAPVSKTTDVKEAATPPPAPEAPPTAATTPAATAEMPGQIHAEKEEIVPIDTDLYHIVFSNTGAVVKSWILKKYTDHDGRPLDLVNPAAAAVPMPFSIDYRNYLRPTSSFSPLASGKQAISGLNPSSATPAGPDFELAVDGSGFAAASRVVWNGSPLPTRIDRIRNEKGQEIGDNEHRLFASVPAGLISLAGIANIAVLNADGAYSNTIAYPIDPNNARYKVDRDGDSLTFEFSDGRLDVKKTFEFGQDSYLSRVTSQVSQNGVMLPHELQWRGGFGDETIANPAAAQHALLFDPNAPRSYGIFNNQLQAKDASVAKNGPVTSSGQYTFAGMEDAYFAAVFLPAGASSLKLTILSDSVPTGGKEVPHVGTAVGGEGFNSLELYVGPKDVEILKRVNPKLEAVIAWGKFEIIAKPLFEMLKWTAGKVGGSWSYGWAIILVTIAINTVLFPLKITSMKSSKKMQAIQPQIAAINAKYKGLSLNDPKKADQNTEIMALYKQHGVNPAGGCLPMILQLPFLFAFYAVLGVAIQLRGAHWLWVTDLSQQESLPIHILPVILVATQFLTQRMTPSPGMDPSQQKMMMVMPLVMGYMFYFQMSGLVIYWLTGNVVGVAQQWFLNRGTPKPPPPKVVDVKAVPKKKK